MLKQTLIDDTITASSRIPFST